MADEPETPEKKPARRVKKPVPEEAPTSAAALPAPAEVKAAKKAQLVEWAKGLDLDAEGKVDELRGRLLKEIAKRSAPPAKEEEPAAEAKPAGKARGKKARKEPKKEPARKPAEKPAKKGKKGEEEEEEETKEHVARAKPELPPEVRAALAVREEIASRRPRFLRQEWFRHPRLGLTWRKPQGGQSKLRRHYGYRINVVSIGYRGPRTARGLHPSGFQEVLVHNPAELKGIDPKRQAVRIAGTVGGRKRKLIQDEAEELGVRVLNRRES